jgi:uncharacterized membrane protein
MLPLVLVFAGCGLLIVLLAIPMIRRRVKPNGLYGLRVPATFADEWVWYEANARTGLDMLWLGLLLLVLALALPLVHVSENAYALGWSAVAVVGALAMAIIGWSRANRLLRERQSGQTT